MRFRIMSNNIWCCDQNDPRWAARGDQRARVGSEPPFEKGGRKLLKSLRASAVDSPDKSKFETPKIKKGSFKAPFFDIILALHRRVTLSLLHRPRGR